MNKEEYRQYLLSQHWIIFKRRYYKRHKKGCSRCGSEINVQLHHKTYVRIGRERQSDVIPLCRKCHKKEHLKLKKLKSKRNSKVQGKRSKKKWMNKPCNVGVWD